MKYTPVWKNSKQKTEVSVKELKPTGLVQGFTNHLCRIQREHNFTIKPCLLLPIRATFSKLLHHFWQSKGENSNISTGRQKDNGEVLKSSMSDSKGLKWKIRCLFSMFWSTWILGAVQQDICDRRGTSASIRKSAVGTSFLPSVSIQKISH